METPATIFVVDDDPAVRRALEGVGQLLGMPVVSFASAGEFLEAYDRKQAGCLVLDIKMPGMTGLELQQKLREEGVSLPIIIISGHADVRIAVAAMSQGAVTVLEKPFSMQELMTHIRKAIERNLADREAKSRHAEAAGRLAQLSTKEREVLDLILAGKTNKQIAGEIHLSIRAVEDRRGRVMRKLRVRSLAELVRLAGPRDDGG